MTYARAIALALCAAGALASAAITWYYLRYGFDQKPAHAAYVGPDTSLRLMLRPARLQRIVSRAAPDGLKILPAAPRLTSTMGRPQRMDWLHYLPYEVTALLAQEAPETLALTFFVNENPSGPDFAGVLNSAGFFGGASRPISWSGNLRPGAGPGMAAEGALHLSQPTQTTLQGLWPGPGPAARLPEPAARFLAELSADNRHGVLLAAHATLGDALGPVFGDRETDRRLREAWAEVAELRLIARLAGRDQVIFTLTAEASDPGGANAVRDAARAAAESAAAYLERAHGMAFSGEIAVRGATVSGEYLLDGLETRIERAFGIPRPG